MHEHDAVIGLESRQRRLELQRFLYRLVHEVLDDLFAPRTERATPKATAESANSGEPDAAKFPRVSVQHVDADVSQDLTDVTLLTRLEVVIPQHADHRDLDRRQVLRQHTRLFRQPIVSEVATQDKHVGRFRDLIEERLEAPLRALGIVNVGERRQTNHVPTGSQRHRHF